MSEHWHRKALEPRGALFAILTTVAISIGGLVEIIPMFGVSYGPEPLEGIHPLTPLEVAGRDIYIREGCMTCHSQMIRPMRSEKLRYGEWSRAGEYQYDHPFLLGSRRIGPDLARIGGKYPDGWHYEHMRDPRSTSPGSIMPTYTWLLDDSLDPEDVRASVSALRHLGVPYTDEDIATVPQQLTKQGTEIVERLKTAEIDTQPDRDIIALIAYLQRLGVDGKKTISSTAEGGS